jgi:hypothetical protein
MISTAFSLPVRAKPNDQVKNEVHESPRGNEEAKTPDIPDPSAAIIALMREGREDEATKLKGKSYYTEWQTF